MLAGGTLAGRVAVVSGAGSGIGRAIATRFVELGATVVGVGRTEQSLREAAEASTAPDRYRVSVCDVTDQEAWSGTIDRVGRELGLDILVNNAGGQFSAPAEHISPNGWRTVMTLNLDAVFWACQAAHPFLARSAHGGRILNIGLSGVDRGTMGIAHGIAARAGVLGLTRTLALEWAHEGIRANCIGPGVVRTAALLEKAEPRVFDRLIPSGRATDPEELAELAAFLASPAGAQITGQLLQIDGGAAIGPGLHVIRPGAPRATPGEAASPSR